MPKVLKGDRTLNNETNTWSMKQAHAHNMGITDAWISPQSDTLKSKESPRQTNTPHTNTHLHTDTVLHNTYIQMHALTHKDITKVSEQLSNADLCWIPSIHEPWQCAQQYSLDVDQWCMNTTGTTENTEWRFLWDTPTHTHICTYEWIDQAWPVYVQFMGTGFPGFPHFSLQVLKFLYLIDNSFVT